MNDSAPVPSPRVVNEQNQLLYSLLQQSDQLCRILEKHLGYPFTIQIRYHDVLPRGAGGKFENFLSLVGTS